MARFRFVHAADIHLDSPLRGLEADPGAPAELIRGATRRALGCLVDLTIAEDAAFLVIAGDVYDGDWPDYGTGLFFAAQMRRLTDSGRQVFVVRGNHDAQNRMTRSLRMPHVTLFDADRAHTHLIEPLGVAVHGQSFAEQHVSANLARAYPPPVPGMLNVGVLHTAAEGYAAHAHYAPCERAGLIAHRYDYWALGHIHEREELCRDPCWIVFPGNLQGRHIGETGAKGASVVTVEDGRIVEVQHRDLDDLRWAHLAIDVEGAPDEAAVLERVQDRLGAALGEAGSRHLAARVTLLGATPAHAALAGAGLREKVLNEAHGLAGEHRLWIEAVRLRTTPARAGTLRGRPDALGRLLDEIEALAAAPPRDLLGDWPDTLLDKLRDGLPPDHPLRDCASGAGEAVLARARDLLETALADHDG